MTMDTARTRDLRSGLRLEILTVIWMALEAAISIGAGIVARSFLLTAFGLDSVVELVSGAILLWRLSLETRGADVARAEQAEQRATWFVAVTLGLLCIFVLATSIYSLITQAKPESSPVGIAVALAAGVVMPYLGISKRMIASRIGSDALRGDAAESFTCAYMAAAVLAGLALDALFHWWWAEPLAALVFLFWLVGETRDAETASIAAAASLTGKLVLTTLHSIDALRVIDRLIELGVKRQTLAAGMSAIIAQRPVRLLCRRCRLPAGAQTQRGRGCVHCSDSGFSGRTGIFEVLVIDNALRDAIGRGAPAGDLERIALAGGFETLAQSAMRLAADGETSADELARALRVGTFG